MYLIRLYHGEERPEEIRAAQTEEEAHRLGALAEHYEIKQLTKNKTK